ncbi:MAG: CPBP family intramembrane glutamic endopeptidase, partial [bacterium]
VLARIWGRGLGKCGSGVTGNGVLAGIGWGAIAAFCGIYWMNYLWHSGNLLPHPVVPILSDVLLLIIVIPLIEEFLFRGVVFTWLARYFRTIAVIIIISVLFVITHPDDQLLLLVFVVNIICGVARYFTGSFASSWICRMIYNSTIFLLLTFPAYFINNHKFIYLPLIFGILLLLIQLRKIKQKE